MALANDMKVEDKADYHLQVNMVDTHIDFFVDNALVCSTGDYVVSPDLGQNDALLSGRLGLQAGTGAATFLTARAASSPISLPMATVSALSPPTARTETTGPITAAPTRTVCPTATTYLSAGSMTS